MLRALLLFLAIFTAITSGCSTLADAKGAKGQGKSKIYSQGYDTVWSSIKEVLATSGLSLVNDDKTQGTILAQRGVSALSYGENVAIFVESINSQANTKVEIVSKKVLATNITAKDWEDTLFDSLDKKLIASTNNTTPKPDQTTAFPSISGSYTKLLDISLEKAKLYSEQTSLFMKSNSAEKTLIAVQEAIKKQLKDPDSAKFQDLRIVDYANGKVVCGSVNAKNSYGGYVGYKRFMASPTDYTSIENDSKYPEINEAANTGLYVACGRSQ